MGVRTQPRHRLPVTPHPGGAARPGLRARRLPAVLVTAREYPQLPMLRVLLTNDDGIEADGLQALRRALLAVEDVQLAVIAPDGNRSAMARSITTRRPLWVEEVDFRDGTVGY